MLRHTPERAGGWWRRWVFAVWVSLTVFAAVYVAVVGPFTGYFGEGMWLVGVIVPPLMIFLLGLGLGWLLWLVTASRRSERRP